MAIIYTYPQADSLENNDLFVISHMDAEPGSTIRQTRSISAAKLADYIIPLLPPIPSGGPFLPLVAGPTTPLTGDLYMDPDGTGAGSGSHAIVFSGIDDTGAQLVGGEIFTQDSTIAPSGQDLVFNNADDNGVLQTNLFIDAFGSVGVGKTNPNFGLDVANSMGVDGNVTFTSYGSGTKTGVATHNLAVTAGGFVVEEPLTSGTVTGTGTTKYFVKFIDGPNGVIGDVTGVLEEAGEVIFQQDVRFDDVVQFDGGTVSSFQNLEMLDGSPIRFVDTAGPTTDAQLSSVAGSGKLNIDGSLQFDDYGSGTITGTAAYNLSVDASGNVIETASGGVTGSGASGDITFWDGTTSITGDSTTPFFYTTGTQSGTTGRLGLGTSSPNFKMDIAGGDLRFEGNNGIRFGGTGSNNTNWRIATTGDPLGGSYPGSIIMGRAGAATPFFEITTGPFSPNNPGQIIFNQYGSGNFTGTATYNLAVDASGNIIETATGGGGGIGGSGTTNFIAKFSSATTLTDSSIEDDGVTVEVNNPLNSNDTLELFADLKLSGNAGTVGQVLTSAGASNIPTWSTVGFSGYKSVQVFQWTNGNPAAYVNWPNTGGSLLPFDATPLVQTGTYSGTTANFTWTCVNVNAPSEAAGQYAQFTLGSNGAGTWRISTCQHWFDQLNNVNINVVFNLTSGGANNPVGVINEKSADGATTNKIFYGEIIREFTAGDKLEVDVTFSNGGSPGPFPSANDNRPISITFEKLV